MAKPQQVQLVQMGALIRGLDLHKVVDVCNGAQSSFVFTLGQKMNSVGEPSAVNTYTLDSLAARLLSARSSSDVDILVGVIDVQIEDEIFSAVDEDSKCIIVSIDEMREILKRTNVSYTGYILVEIAAQLLTIALRRATEITVKPDECGPPWHQETKACLFDYSEKRDHHGKKLMDMWVCEACEATFSDNNIPASIIGACKAIAERGSGDIQHDAQSGVVSVLYVAGDRGGVQRNQIKIIKEYDTIIDAWRSCKHRDDFVLTPPILAATAQKFSEAYRDRPSVLHFAGHGDDRSLAFILDQPPLTSEYPIIRERLAKILRSFPNRLRLCVLNACGSARVAKYLVTADVVDSAIGWSKNVSDDEATTFSKVFYGGIGNGLGLLQAVTLAANSCNNDKVRLYTNSKIDPAKPIFIERTGK